MKKKLVKKVAAKPAAVKPTKKNPTEKAKVPADKAKVKSAVKRTDPVAKPVGVAINELLGNAFSRGYMQKDEKRCKDYLGILNHLAEGTYDPRLMAQADLAEVIGWLQREHGHLVNHLNAVNSRLLSLAAETLKVNKRLFDKGSRKRG